MTVKTQGANQDNSGGGRRPEMSAGDKTKGVLSYLFLPGIIPEIKRLTQGQFGYLAYLIAIIYQTVRILPSNHPYTHPDNIGKFTIRQAIAQAANNVTVSRNNIDQVIVFIAILAAMLLLVLQFISFFVFIFMGSAWAGPGVPANAGSIFITPPANQEFDIAFYMIREIFGLPTMFGPLAQQTGLHVGLQTLFHFYNLAMLFVGVLIFLYYVIVVVGETAQTGVPFGQRFSHVYAPLRLVIAIGLLVPLNYGFNGAQYIAFYAAKLGSSFATNGWTRFNAVLTDNPLGVENAALIAQPNIPDLSGLVEIMSTIVACKAAYEHPVDLGGGGKTIETYYLDPNNSGAPTTIDGTDFPKIRDSILKAGSKGHISIYFGEIDGAKYTHYCGEVKIPIFIPAQSSFGLGVGADPVTIQEFYYKTIFWLWPEPDLVSLGKVITQNHDKKKGNECNGATYPGCITQNYKPDSSFKQDRITQANNLVDAFFTAVFINARNQLDMKIEQEVLRTGWGGAGIWYNKLAQINGAMTTSVLNIPNVEKRPIVMEEVSKQKQEADGAVDSCKIYNPNLSDNVSVALPNADQDLFYAKVMNETYEYWRCDRSKKGAANFFWDAMSAIFGLNGLFNIRDTIASVDANGNAIEIIVHPLAQLSTIGKSLVDSAIQNMALAMGMSFGGGLLGALGPHLGPALQSASAMFSSIATVGLSIGFILYYILPFLPFMYFFFAVGGWVKGLFEAMVGVPLWALAHLRIDGDGIPGRTAMSGYILIFEIFLRPILTVFGLIGGLAIFSAMANILNQLFDLAVLNTVGVDLTIDNDNLGRHIVDQFFFTVVYAVILYMMAMASFKMINLVPNNIMRWLGQSVSSFNDQAADPAAGLTQYAAIGGGRIGGQLADATSKLSGGLGSAAGEVFGFAAKGSPKQ